MAQHKHTFKKAERLKSRKQIQELFLKGKSLYVHPIKVSYIMKPAVAGQTPAGVKAGVSVSKRYFKKAVDRNLVKRLLREVYRVNNPALAAAVQGKSIALSFFFTYVDRSLPNFDLLQQKVPLCLQKLEEKINTFK